MKKSKVCQTSIGGQAVMEGVMMRGKSSMAIAVRDADGDIRLETRRFSTGQKKSVWSKIPIVRGVVNFFSTFVMGINTLMRSADVYGEMEPSKFEKWLSKKLKLNLMTVITFVALLVGVGLSVALFILLPTFLADITFNIFSIKKASNAIGYSFLVGGFKVVILLGYLLIVSMLKDIKRTFMYHGAEHKTISCYESGASLTVENVQKCSTLHNRCGTTFLFFVIFISVLVFTAFQAIFPALPIIDNYFMQVSVRILLLPFVAGLAYELLKFLAKHDSPIFFPLKAPGLALQKITTKQPDDKMVEVAITAFKAVLEMDNDISVKEVSFITQQKTENVVKEINRLLKEANIEDFQADTDWIISHVLNVSRAKIANRDIIKARDYEKILNLAQQRASGMPLQYVLKETEFYGFKITLDENVLIPRFDTEYVVEKALGFLNKDNNVLDLCTGSGCIAIAINKISGAKVMASDISGNALNIAIKNAYINSAEIDFIESDLFENIPKDINFDLIISNPPYIKTDDIINLDDNVKNYEPKKALDGGKDGLDFYKKICVQAFTFLSKEGILVLECGFDQADDIIKIFSATEKYTNIEKHKDINNVYRIITAKKGIDKI